MRLGGAGICQHQRERSKCKECGRASICQHQRIRSTCKECGGGGHLPAPAPEEQMYNKMQGVRGGEHLRAPAHQGPMQGVASICQYQRIRSACKECGEASICQHQRRRSACKEFRAEADESMPAGLEELGEDARGAGGDGTHVP